MILSIKNISIKYLTVLFLFTISLNRTFSQSINNADVEKNIPQVIYFAWKLHLVNLF